jgi:hypothetical protein
MSIGVLTLTASSLLNDSLLRLAIVVNTTHQSSKPSLPEQHPADDRRQNPNPLTMLSKADLDTAYKSALEAMRELHRKGVAYELLSQEFDDPVDQKLLHDLGLAAGVLQDSTVEKKDGDLQAHKAAGSLPASTMARVPPAVKQETKPDAVMTGQTVSRLPGLTVAIQSTSESSASPQKVSPIPAPNKRTEIDRQKYLERLAAAKNKRIASARPSQEPPTPAQPPPPSIPARPSATSQPLAPASSQHPAPVQHAVQPDPKADSAAEPKPVSKPEEMDSVPREVPMPTKTNPTKTDLVRQRLEALKRQILFKVEVAQQNALSSDGNSPQKSPMKDQQNSGLAAEKPMTIHQPMDYDGSGVKELVQSTHLPGLTTSFPAGQQNDVPRNSPSPVKSAVSQSSESIPESSRSMGSLEPPRPSLRKRPVSADFLDTTSTKKPYAGPIMQEDESCVIELSDDESEGDIDEDEIMTGVNPAISRIERSFMPPLTAPRLPHAPRMPRAEFQNPDSLREATEKVEAEKRALLDRIARAEKRQREKASNAATPVQTPSRRSPVIEQPTPPVLSTAAVEAPAGPTQPGASTSTRRNDMSDTSADLDAYQVKLKKQAELDAVVASNQSKMEELRRQMQALEEENRQKMQDRDNLARELQRLGVDTVGMSHTDLQATKDRIEGHIAQNDVAMEDVGVHAEAGAEGGHAMVDLPEPRPISRDDVSVQKSDLEEGEWRSSEVGITPPETQDAVPTLANLPTSHPVNLPTERPGTRAPDAPIALDEIPSQDYVSRILQRPRTADSYNSLSSGEIMEDDSPMILDNDEPEQEIIQGSSNDDILAKNLDQEAIELSTVEAVERQTSADESNGDEDYEPELTINDSAPTEAGPLNSHHAVKACQKVMGQQSLMLCRTKRSTLGSLRMTAR